MASLRRLLVEVLHRDPHTSTLEEIREACELIIEAEELPGEGRDCISHCFAHGPLEVSTIFPRSHIAYLERKGYIACIAVRGQDGYIACTARGAWLARILIAMAE